MHAEHRVEEQSGPKSGIQLRHPPLVVQAGDPYEDEVPTISAIKVPFTIVDQTRFVVIARRHLVLVCACWFVAGMGLAVALRWVQ
jgi:hypothetical protein